MKPGASRGFVVFAGILRGVLEKWVQKRGVFGGKSRVNCVVKRGELTGVFRARKTRHLFELFFQSFR